MRMMDPAPRLAPMMIGMIGILEADDSQEADGDAIEVSDAVAEVGSVKSEVPCAVYLEKKDCQ